MWFAASLLFKSTHIPTEPKPTIWEESIRLIQANTEAEAHQRADRIGTSCSHTYNVQGGTVIWQFERVQSIYPIEEDELRDGLELFSRFLKDSEARSLLEPFDD
jgi:hypothetical protein